jgi:hypothetical protein
VPCVVEALGGNEVVASRCTGRATLRRRFHFGLRLQPHSLRALLRWLEQGVGQRLVGGLGGAVLRVFGWRLRVVGDIGGECALARYAAGICFCAADVLDLGGGTGTDGPALATADTTDTSAAISVSSAIAAIIATCGSALALGSVLARVFFWQHGPLRLRFLVAAGRVAVAGLVVGRARCAVRSGCGGGGSGAPGQERGRVGVGGV